MKKTKIMLAGLLATTSIFASDALITKAKDAGMKAIPSNKIELLKLIDNPKNPITDAKVTLGKRLFFEPRLSKSGLISCNTCHNLGMGGTDGVGAATGHKWTANPAHLNSPTVYNAVFNKAQFWDGRSPDLEDQAQGPMQAGPEMAAPKSLVEKRINTMPAYVKEFKSAYGNDVKIDFELITATIGLYERTLVTPSRFDKFMEGDTKALTKAEKTGLKIFIDKGCASCHNGVGLGETMQPFPAVNAYKYADVGGFKGDKNGMMKTATLRNIEETAPYFHNGAIWSLSEAVKEMGSTQLGIKISNKEAKKITTFLKSLTGDKGDISYPQLPVITNKTPKPDMK
ncbi:MAG: cytochrome-c peroxidase [Campylobacterota bacterium]|nr:cytochrome-c peroxidase [Campylobacterota bacterium]